MLFCDLDCFKEVNDNHGHAAGDEVLVATAERVASALRAGDVVARLGGDEFVVFLTEISDVATCHVFARSKFVSCGVRSLDNRCRADVDFGKGITLGVP